MREIQPYGEEWVKEMMKFKKLSIIRILRGMILRKDFEIDQLKNELVAYRELGRARRA